MLLIGAALTLVAAGLVVHGLMLDSAAGDCYSPQPGATDCGGGPGDAFIFLGPAVFVVGIFSLTLGPGMIRSMMARGVRQSGRDGTGTVISVQDTGVTVNNSPQVRMRLNVTPADGSAPFTAEVTQLVSRLSIPGPGDVYRVRYDPAHRGRVAVMPDAPQVSPPAAPAGADVISELERLNTLHASGALTDAEFEELKQRLIRGGHVL